MWKAPRKNDYGWYVANTDKDKEARKDVEKYDFGDRYLHTDGNIYHDTYNKKLDEYTGYFKTRGLARQAIRRFNNERNSN